MVGHIIQPRNSFRDSQKCVHVGFLDMSYQIKSGLSNTKIRHGEIDKKNKLCKIRECCFDKMQMAGL